MSYQKYNVSTTHYTQYTQRQVKYNINRLLRALGSCDDELERQRLKGNLQILYFIRELIPKDPSDDSTPLSTGNS